MLQQFNIYSALPVPANRLYLHGSAPSPISVEPSKLEYWKRERMANKYLSIVLRSPFQIAGPVTERARRYLKGSRGSRSLSLCWEGFLVVPFARIAAMQNRILIVIGSLGFGMISIRSCACSLEHVLIPGLSKLILKNLGFLGFLKKN